MPIMTNSGEPVVSVAGKKILAVILALALALSSSVYAFAVGSTLTVEIVDGDDSVIVLCDSTDPYEIVDKAGFILEPVDELNADGFSAENGGKIVINRAKLIRIDADANISYLIGFNETVGDIVEISGITLKDGDEIADRETQDVSKADMQAEISDGMRLFVKRAFTVNIVCDGKTKKVAIASGTVADALNRAGIELGENDVVSVPLNSYVYADMTVKVTRITYKTRTKKEKVKFETKEVKDDDMIFGEEKIVTEGKDGEQLVIYHDKYQDGKKVSSVAVSKDVKKKPVTQVKHIGTKRINELARYKNSGNPISELDPPASLEIGDDGAPVNYEYVINGKATAYTGDPETSTGRKPMPGHIAVDPTEIPYGSKLYITSADGTYIYGYSVAADTGGFVEMGNTDIDLYMNTEEMCLDWGNRAVKIYVLA